MKNFSQIIINENMPEYGKKRSVKIFILAHVMQCMLDILSK